MLGWGEGDGCVCCGNFGYIGWMFLFSYFVGGFLGSFSIRLDTKFF
jgi:hypothetical protein